MPSLIKELNKENFDKFVREENRVIIDFYAEWCGPCQMLKPVLEETAKELKDKVKFGKVNVDDSSEIAQRFQVMSIPAMIFFKDKEQVHRIHGSISKASLIKEIKENL